MKAVDKVLVAKQNLTALLSTYTQYSQETLIVKWEFERLINELQLAQREYFNELRQNHVDNDITKFSDWLFENRIVRSNAVQGKWYNQRDGYYIKDSSELYCLYLSEQ